MSETTERSAYDKLSPQRKQLADMLVANLDSGGLWKQGWRTRGAPENAVTGKKYRGVNNLYLFLVAMERGYSDNRWLTFNQMKARDWSFKTDAEGKSLGKNAGVSVEFFDLWDRDTHEKFDRSVLDGMSADERQAYMDENVYPIRRYYTVFNADLIDGIPEKEVSALDESAKSERAERMLAYWNEHESKIVYGGSQAYYSKMSDEIHLPVREDFYDMQEFYSTALHEMGHSTGHETRLNRPLNADRNSEEYAMEELRAEIASVFMEQDFGIDVDENAVRNSGAYVGSWKSAIKSDPNALFTAIADADKIAKYVLQKEAVMKKQAALESVEEEKAEIYMLPSEAAALATERAEERRENVMKSRGKESLTRMDDSEVVERAEKSKGGAKFVQLYNGISLTGNEDKDEYSLMARFAMFTDDKAQLMRLFKSSAQFRDEKPNAHYEKLADESLSFIAKMKTDMLAASMNAAGGRAHFGLNAKS